MNRVIMEVLPTASSPKKTSLYLDRGMTVDCADVELVLLVLFTEGADDPFDWEAGALLVIAMMWNDKEKDQ